MPIVVKTSIAKPKAKIKKISAVDSETLTAELNKLTAWTRYEVTPTATPKLDKEKKVTAVTIKAAPVAHKPTWNQYSKTTKKRKAEWDRLTTSIDDYMSKTHDLYVKAVDAFVKDLKSQDLDKSAFDKLWKDQKDTLQSVIDDYISKTSDGDTLGVNLELIDPDPAETKKDIKKPTVSQSNKVSGTTIAKVFEALEAKRPWGKYRSNQKHTPKYAIDGTLSKITISATPSITMPKWTNYAKANAEQKKTWASMYAALLKHEHNHHEKFVTAVDELLTEIKDMGLKKADLEKRWTKFNKDLKTTQDNYDASSDHGGNEGVILDENADPDPEE